MSNIDSLFVLRLPVIALEVHSCHDSDWYLSMVAMLLVTFRWLLLRVQQQRKQVATPSWRRWSSAVDLCCAGLTARSSTSCALLASTSIWTPGSTTSALLYFGVLLLLRLLSFAKQSPKFLPLQRLLLPIFCCFHFSQVHLCLSTTTYCTCYRCAVLRMNHWSQRLHIIFEFPNLVYLLTWFHHFGVVMRFVNSCINPFIYAAKYGEFQNGVRRMVERIKGSPHHIQPQQNTSSNPMASNPITQQT